MTILAIIAQTCKLNCTIDLFREIKDIKPTKTGSSNGWNGHDVNFEFVSSTNSNQTISMINELDWSK